MNLNREIAENGFCVVDLMEESELDQIIEIIFKEFCLALDKNKVLNPLKTKRDLVNYHKFDIAINHGDFWSKSKRILGPSSLKKFFEMSFMQRLREILGEFHISNEEGVQSAEIYWRLVRPNNNKDIGKPHADKWFWDNMELNAVVIENKKYERLKIWMPLYSELGVSGLQVEKKSHLKQYSYLVNKINGRLKVESAPENKFSLEVLNLHPGHAVIFHDNLLHAGSLGENQTRMSLEFTILRKL